MPDRTVSYDVSARGYLHRARQRLDDLSRESLFYAAFELRAGIEARLREYLDVHRSTSAKKRRGWVIPKLARGLERAFRLEKVARVTVEHPQGAFEPLVLLYTPVPKELQRLGERMGDLLHSARYHADDDAWWNQQRTFLEEAYRGLRLAAAGTLLGPLLVSRDGKAQMLVELPAGELGHRYRDVLQRTQMESLRLRVEYVDDVPEGMHDQ